MEVDDNAVLELALCRNRLRGIRVGADMLGSFDVHHGFLEVRADGEVLIGDLEVGVGIGNAIHAGMVVVADGTDAQAERLERVLTTDPGTGVMRHVDAGYPEALAAAEEGGLRVPRVPGDA